MTPTLSSQNLILKNQTKPQQQLVDWLNDPAVVMFSEQRHRKHTIDTCRRYINSFDGETSHLWMIQNLKGEFVGTISARRDTENKIIEDVGILIGKPFWGQGFGTEAWAKVCSWLFGLDYVRKIEAGCMSDNHAMRKVFDKTGFKFAGEKKNHFLRDGAPVGLSFYEKMR